MPHTPIIVTTNTIKSAFLGLAIGDALGVPVEFKPREYLNENPVTDFMGFGTHSQMPGTFSDDASMAFCLAESLIQGYELDRTAQYFLKWYKEQYWTARGNIFDIGLTTQEVMQKLADGHSPKHSGKYTINSNGNGSLMRTLPLAFYTANLPIQERFRITTEVSKITHAHALSYISCFYYTEFARELIQAKTKEEAFQNHILNFTNFLSTISFDEDTLPYFARLLSEDFQSLTSPEIKSTGFVIDTLEASMWCFLNTSNFSDAVLKAVNLGDDADTVGCVTGGLAGLFYPLSSIPAHWISQLARSEDIVNLAERLEIRV